MKNELKNLRKIWDQKKTTLGLTQSLAAPLLGFETQGAVGHYLSGHKELSLEIITRFAKLLRCQPCDIDPELDWLRINHPDKPINRDHLSAEKAQFIDDMMGLPEKMFLKNASLFEVARLLLTNPHKIGRYLNE